MGFLEHDEAAINRLLHDVVKRFNGRISAEHGIGQYRVAELLRYYGSDELALARRIKRALDPEHLLNPGKIMSRFTPVRRPASDELYNTIT